MPKIYLKPNSPEFHDGRAKPQTVRCDMPGCREHGEFRAPKDRSLSAHYLFCQEHVREYNKAWNFFDGMADSEVEEHMTSALYGDRPTWKYGVNGRNAHEELYPRAWQTFNFTEEEPNYKRAHDPGNGVFSQHSQEHKAMALMGLEPPVTLAGIKARYKELAKKHHPDLNKGCTKSEELLKEINMAYTVLRLAYERFEDLPERA
ncbi:MAG: DnaJ domain-containing protein [Alphaproteobacteria bacterium]